MRKKLIILTSLLISGDAVFASLELEKTMLITKKVYPSDCIIAIIP